MNRKTISMVEPTDEKPKKGDTNLNQLNQLNPDNIQDDKEPKQDDKNQKDSILTGMMSGGGYALQTKGKEKDTEIVGEKNTGIGGKFRPLSD